MLGTGVEAGVIEVEEEGGAGEDDIPVRPPSPPSALAGPAGPGAARCESFDGDATPPVGGRWSIQMRDDAKWTSSTRFGAVY